MFIVEGGTTVGSPHHIRGLSKFTLKGSHKDPDWKTIMMIEFIPSREKTIYKFYTEFTQSDA